MANRSKLFLTAGLFFINTAGFFLRYFELDTYFILLGFRFHFSILFLFLFALKYIEFDSVKKLLVNPQKVKFFPVIVAALFPLLLVAADIFLIEQFNLSEKDYFFELGISSVIDFPVYFIWNTPQIFLFFISIITVTSRGSFIESSLITFFLFLYEIIPLDIIESVSFPSFNYISVIEYILIVLITGLQISRIKNIYIFSFVIFTILWGTVLLFGSNSDLPVNILLASQYERWEGILNPGRLFEYSNYISSLYLTLLLLISLIVIKKQE